MIDPRAVRAADDMFSAAFGWRPGGSQPAPRVHDTRACPDCGRPQHYTGTEYGWAHDAVIDLMRCCASPELLAEMEKCRERDERVTPR